MFSAYLRRVSALSSILVINYIVCYLVKYLCRLACGRASLFALIVLILIGFGE